MKAIRPPSQESQFSQSDCAMLVASDRTHTLTALLTTRTYYRHGVTQVNALTQTQVDAVVVWRSRLAFFFSSPVEPDREDPNCGHAARAKGSATFFWKRNCGNANVNQLGRNLLVGSEGMTIESLTAVQSIISHRQNKHFFLQLPSLSLIHTSVSSSETPIKAL